MPSLSGIFNLAAQALGAFQAGIAVAGDNIANANTEGYSRQRLNLATEMPIRLPEAIYGMGVKIQGIERLRDEALDIRIRQQSASNGFLTQSRDIYNELQTTLQDSLGIVSADLNATGDVGLNHALIRFFDAFGELALEPESSQARTLVIEQTRSLITTFHAADEGLKGFRRNLNEQVPFLVDEVNTLAEQVANLNKKIGVLELGGARKANTLRDERGRLLKELSEIVPIQIREQPNGAVNINLGGLTLVSGGRSVDMVYTRRDGDPNGTFDLFMEGNNAQRLDRVIDAGKLGAVLEARDVTIPEFMDRLEKLASAIITEVNRIHTVAMGSVPFRSLNAGNAVDESSLPLNLAGFDHPMTAGSFDIGILDENGDPLETYSIAVDPTTDSIDDIAQRIDAADGVVGGGAIEATVGANGILNISANGTQQFRFTADSSGFLSAAGLNTFFSGSGSGNINLSSLVESNLAYIAASAMGAPGDGSAAMQIAALRDTGVMNGGTTSIIDHYEAIVSSMGMQGRRNEELAVNSQALLESLEHRQEEFAGVSVDEEAVEMMRYQRAFQAAARLISTVDEMMETLVNL